ncbi:type I glutamate--ammonia ligase [Blautia sp. 2744]|uniref:Glutamine synthetase n=1 Tax=Blautia intestinalis TaxID=2763028 RepID=A0ABR7I0U8_9FIRM|nr:type I glutamate--ammonia ligase [Blautia intestinalis]MBC5740123.1 type I glutamate--ammonia ligase [Blautia intestinalis]RHD33156.1 type I glutamate--ammonia ligase [Blautia obeum]
MGNYTREEILQMVEEEDVEFIRLQFTDMFGAIKNIAVTARELPRALDNRCMINGEQIAGMDMEKGSDLYLSPILDTFAILPWRPQQGKVARMICDLYCPDGTPYKNSPRYILERVAKEAEQEGYTCYIDPECEFFLFHTDDNGMPTTVTHEKAGYLDMSPLDLGENARRDMVLTLEDMGMEVESSHHEAAPAQHEIDFSYGEVRDIADCIMTFKMAVRIVAKRHGLHATFMPKPKTEANGSGMHIQFSLIKNGENVFECADRPGELSEDAYYFIGGLLAHSKEMALITNPLVNSYKRLVPGYDAPTELTWTENNQNSLVRIPVTRGEGIRVELRSPDASANPYVVLAVCLAAGLDGIKNKITPTKSSNLATQDQQAEHLPETLKEAIDYFESSSWVKEVLGEEFCRQYVAAKKNEWLRYTRQVTDWEIAEYLYRL